MPRTAKVKGFSKTINSRRITSSSSADDTTTFTIVHISDTHSIEYTNIPDGDILIHSGDFSNQGVLNGDTSELECFVRYFLQLPHKHKILMPGNHEIGLDTIPLDELKAMCGCGPEYPNNHLLVDESVTIEGIVFYGTPWNTCSMAWPCTNKEKRQRMWDKIPADTDVLITHQPPYKVFDYAWQRDGKFYHWGCPMLLKKVEEEVQPALHCFGHVHDEVGVKQVKCSTGRGPVVTYSNAAMDLSKTANVMKFRVPTAPLTAATPAAVPNNAVVAPKPTPPPPAGMKKGFLLHNDAHRAAQQKTPLCLDLDACDATKSTVFLWKYLNSMNQVWLLLQVSEPEGTAGGCDRAFQLTSAIDSSLFLGVNTATTDGSLLLTANKIERGQAPAFPLVVAREMPTTTAHSSTFRLEVQGQPGLVGIVPSQGSAKKGASIVFAPEAPDQVVASFSMSDVQ